jgi:hypothetical protein
MIQTGDDPSGIQIVHIRWHDPSGCIWSNPPSVMINPKHSLERITR